MDGLFGLRERSHLGLRNGAGLAEETLNGGRATATLQAETGGFPAVQSVGVGSPGVEIAARGRWPTRQVTAGRKEIGKHTHIGNSDSTPNAAVRMAGHPGLSETPRRTL